MKTIGVLIADEYEYAPFCAFADKHGAVHSEENGFKLVEFELFGNKMIAVETGIGKVNATIAAMKLVEEKKIDELYNIGFSGAIRGLRRGKTIAASEYQECDFDLTALGRAPGEKPGQNFIYHADEAMLKAAEAIGLYVCKVGTGDFFLTSQAKKDEYYDLFGVCAFDMESAAIGSVCERYAVPFMSIRKISDDAEGSAAEDYKAMNESLEMGLTDTLTALLKYRYDG